MRKMAMLTSSLILYSFRNSLTTAAAKDAWFTFIYDCWMLQTGERTEATPFVIIVSWFPEILITMSTSGRTNQFSPCWLVRYHLGHSDMWRWASFHDDMLACWRFCTRILKCEYRSGRRRDLRPRRLILSFPIQMSFRSLIQASIPMERTAQSMTRAVTCRSKDCRGRCIEKLVFPRS